MDYVVALWIGGDTNGKVATLDGDGDGLLGQYHADGQPCYGRTFCGAVLAALGIVVPTQGAAGGHPLGGGEYRHAWWEGETWISLAQADAIRRVDERIRAAYAAGLVAYDEVLAIALAASAEQYAGEA